MNTVKLWRVTTRKLHFVAPRVRSALIELDETGRWFLPVGAMPMTFSSRLNWKKEQSKIFGEQPVKTTTINFTKPEFDTLLLALRIFKNDKNFEAKKKVFAQLCRLYPDLDFLLESEEIQDLMEKIKTSTYGKRCRLCGWNATCAFNSTDNAYCDECVQFKEDWPERKETQTAQPENENIEATRGHAPSCTISRPRERKMQLDSTMKGEFARDYCEKMLKLDPAKHDFSTIDRVEVYGTDIDDPGEDYCEFRVIDSNDKTIAVRREMGY